MTPRTLTKGVSKRGEEDCEHVSLIASSTHSSISLKVTGIEIGVFGFKEGDLNPSCSIKIVGLR